MVKNSQCGVGVAYKSKVASKLNMTQNESFVQMAEICLVFKNYYYHHSNNIITLTIKRRRKGMVMHIVCLSGVSMSYYWQTSNYTRNKDN